MLGDTNGASGAKKGTTETKASPADTKTAPPPLPAETGSQKTGRPRVPPQTMPLIVSNARSRVTEKVVMSAPTARDLRGYVEWASSKIGIPQDEAMILLLDRALGEFFKKDRLWLEYREQVLDGGQGKERE